jgi:hypothetical protein
MHRMEDACMSTTPDAKLAAGTQALKDSAALIGTWVVRVD